MAQTELDVASDLMWTGVIIVLLFITDFLMVKLKWFPEAKSNNRYMSLHVLINAYVTIVTIDDVYLTYFGNTGSAYQGPTDTKALQAILALHLYHIIMYRPLAAVDWWHHGIMVLLMLPLAYIIAPGYMLSHGCFYASGLPGGIDYAMLVAVHRGWMDKMTEKKYNVIIQNWIRNPGCIIHSTLTWTNYQTGKYRFLAGEPIFGENSTLPLVSRDNVYYCMMVVMLSFYWNGPYFLERVIRSHERHAIKQAAAAKKEKPT